MSGFSEKLRIGVLGGGYWGRNVVRSLESIEGVKVKAICDPNKGNQEELRRLFPTVSLVSDPEELIADPQIDAICIVTPPSLHYLPAKVALQAGKHVFVEKPMAMSYKEGLELVELADQKGKVLFVDETFLYDPALLLVKELVEEKAIGEIQYVVLERLGMGRIRCDSNVWWNSAPHDLSIIRFLLRQRPLSIAVTGKAFLQEELEDVVLANLELEGGILVWVHLSWCYPKSTASLTVIGEKGAIFYEGRFTKRQVILYSFKFGTRPTESVWGVPSPNLIPAQSKEEKTWTDFGKDEPLYLALCAFIDAIDNGKDVPSLGRYSLETLRLLDLGQLSLKNGGMKITL